MWLKTVTDSNHTNSDEEEVDELIGLLQDTDIKESCHTPLQGESDSEDEDASGEYNDGGLNSVICKGHIDGIVGEVDKFMASGGYHVFYIGSVPVM